MGAQTVPSGQLVVVQDRGRVDSEDLEEKGRDDAGPVLAGVAVEHGRQAAGRTSAVNSSPIWRRRGRSGRHRGHAESVPRRRWSSRAVRRRVRSGRTTDDGERPRRNRVGALGAFHVAAQVVDGTQPELVVEGQVAG